MTQVDGIEGVRELHIAGVIGDQDLSEIEAFHAFLTAVSTWPRTDEPVKGKSIRLNANEPWITVPDEWIPYVLGTGDAP